MNRQWRKVIACLMLLVLGIAMISNTCYAEKNGWEEGCYYINGKKQTKKWVKDGGNTYYVDSKGKKLKGWHKIKGYYYFLNDQNKNGAPSKPLGVKLTKLSKKSIVMGIDVSEWQGNVDWNKVKDAGVKFVMMRIGYGKGRYGSKNCTMDKRFKTYVKGITEAGIPLGIYFYTYATTAKQAQREAEFTIENLQDIPVSFPIAYDIEDSHIVENTDKQTRTEMTKTFMDTIAAAGYHPAYYCNQNWYDNFLDSEALEDYDFWYARYTYVEPSRDDYPFTMWQASSTQKMSGITSNSVDVDFLYVDYFKKIKTRKEALKYGWHKEEGKLRYYYKGKPMDSGWLSIAGERYYLRNSEAVTGWHKIEGNRFYFNKNGEMQTGFVKIAGDYYLFNEEGVQQLDTDEPGVTIDEDGICHIKKGWHKDKSGRYIYRYSNGKLAKDKWITVGGKKYYVDSGKHRVTGFKTIKKQRYYFDKNGVMKKGWITYLGKKYYMKSNGQMVRGKTIKIKGKKYTFDKKGVLKKK